MQISHNVMHGREYDRAEHVTVLEVTQKQDVIRSWTYTWREVPPFELVLPFDNSQNRERCFINYTTTPVRQIVVDGQEHLLAISPELERIVLLALEDEAHRKVYKQLTADLGYARDAENRHFWKIVDLQTKLDDFNKKPWWKRAWISLKGIE